MRVHHLLAASAAAFALSGAATAEELDFSFNAAITTDYVFRGVSQTDESFAVQGGVDATYGIGYGGVWASNVEFGDSTFAEIDVYGGVKPVYEGFTFDLGFVYYGYTNQPAGNPWDYWEAKAGVSHALGAGSVGAVVYYSPEFTGKTGDAFYTEVNAAYPVMEKLTVSAALGHQEIDLAPSYTTWNLGGTFALTPNVGIDLRYYDTDGHSLGKIYGSRVVGTLKAVF